MAKFEKMTKWLSNYRADRSKACETSNEERKTKKIVFNNNNVMFTEDEGYI